MSAGSDYQRLRAHLAFLRMGAAAEALPGLLDEAAKAGLGNQAFLERRIMGLGWPAQPADRSQPDPATRSGRTTSARSGLG